MAARSRRQLLSAGMAEGGDRANRRDALADIPDIVRGAKGTLISKQFAGLSWHD